MVFVSPASLRSRRDIEEITEFAQASNRSVFPLLINGAEPGDLPLPLAPWEALVVRDDEDILTAVTDIATFLHYEAYVNPPSDEEYRRAGQFAGHIVDDLRGPAPEEPEAAGRVFLVHGHDHELRDEVGGFLRGLGVEPVILAQVGEKDARTIVEKFERSAAKAAFAVVVLSADDMGTSRRQYEENPDVSAYTLKFRSRENVILELGYFYGRLGWEKVFIVQGRPPRNFPDFERPSDLGGVEFFVVGGERDWKRELSSRLVEAGLVRRS